jgi:hypothetical protein
MSFLKKLPIDALLQITQYLDIEELIYLRRVNAETLKYFDNKNFLNPLSFQKIGVHVNNFNEMLKLYNYKYITLHSLKYFSLNECFYKCGAEKNLKYAYFFKEKGATNYYDFLISVCETGNIHALDLALTFLNSDVLNEVLVQKAVIGAAKGGHLKIIQCFTESAIFNDSFLETANIIVEHNQLEIVKWIFEEWISKTHSFNTNFVVDTLIKAAIKHDNFGIVELILAHNSNLYITGIVTHSIEHATLKMFKHLVYHKVVKNFVTPIEDKSVFSMIKFGRLDIIKFLHTSGVINFDQFQWDVMLLHSCLKGEEDSNLLEKNRKLLVEYCLLNGGKLYKTVLHYSIFEKSCDLIEYILRQDDITTNIQSRDYMVKLYFCNRYYTNPGFLLESAIAAVAELIISKFTGQINYNDLFFHACRCGNKDLIDEVINKGCDSYKWGAFQAYKSGHYSIANYLFNK